MERQDLIPTFDLFSGIGGFSLALHNICRTVAYCEIDLNCRNVLRKNMKKNLIDKAPIFEDIHDLNQDNLVIRPHMLTAGFPCQDISASSQTKTGIEGVRSNLVFEILRLATILPSINIIFLENSSLFSTRGLVTVVDELKLIGFSTFVWSNFAATEVDAPHGRKRCYFIAIKKDQPLPVITMRQVSWPHEVSPRVLLKDDLSLKGSVIRYKMLGNAVVPRLTQFAWNSLVGQGSEGKRQSPVHVISNNNYYLRKRCMGIPKTEYRITISDGINSYTKLRWATPACSYWTAYTLSDRSSRVLVNQILLERKTQDYISHQTGRKMLTSPQSNWRVNPKFIEWLMGFPANWTMTI